MRVCTCVLGVVLGWLFLNNLHNCYISISVMKNEVVLTLTGYHVFWLHSFSIFLLVTGFSSDTANSSARQLVYLYTTGPITFHKLQHGILGIVSALHVNTIPQVKNSTGRTN